jgi:hypothetical protein
MIIQGGVRGGVEKKEEEELKDQIDMKVSTKRLRKSNSK